MSRCNTSSGWIEPAVKKAGVANARMTQSTAITPISTNSCPEIADGSTRIRPLRAAGRGSGEDLVQRRALQQITAFPAVIVPAPRTVGEPVVNIQGVAFLRHPVTQPGPGPNQRGRGKREHLTVANQ